MTCAYRECPRGLFARILSDEGIPTKMDRGLKAGPTKRPENRGQWSRSTISGMLRNKDYTGQGSRMKSLPQEERIECPIPAIIDEETFQAVQALLARNKALAKRNRRREYLFSGGRLRCGRCGRAMVGKLSETSNITTVARKSYSPLQREAVGDVSGETRPKPTSGKLSSGCW